jgi:hypothetical protein
MLLNYWKVSILILFTFWLVNNGESLEVKCNNNLKLKSLLMVIILGTFIVSNKTEYNKIYWPMHSLFYSVAWVSFLEYLLQVYTGYVIVEVGQSVFWYVEILLHDCTLYQCCHWIICVNENTW